MPHCGAVASRATLVLVVVTLVGTLPVYAQVAGRSYAGQGSIAILENLFSGWKSKVLVLVLLGFTATDFVITMTLSAANAARHASANAYHPGALLGMETAGISADLVSHGNGGPPDFVTNVSN